MDTATGVFTCPNRGFHPLTPNPNPNRVMGIKKIVFLQMPRHFWKCIGNCRNFIFHCGTAQGLGKEGNQLLVVVALCQVRSGYINLVKKYFKVYFSLSCAVSQNFLLLKINKKKSNISSIAQAFPEMPGVSANAQAIGEIPQLPRHFWKCLGISGNA